MKQGRRFWNIGTQDAANSRAELDTPCFFYESQHWDSLPEGSFDGTLFSARLSLPLEPSTLDRHCAPYICGYGADAYPIPTLTALLCSGVATLGMGMHPQSPEVREQLIDQLCVFNLLENEKGQVIPRSVAACFQDGWWCASFPIGALVPHVQETPVEHTLRARALLQLLGKPTCILLEETEEPMFTASLKAGKGRLRYLLVYEKEGYALVFHLCDTVSHYYRLCALSVTSCLYYPSQYWKQEKKGKKVLYSRNGEQTGD